MGNVCVEWFYFHSLYYVLINVVIFKNLFLKVCFVYVLNSYILKDYKSISKTQM